MLVVVEAVQKRDVPLMGEFVARTTASATVEVRPNVEGRLMESSFEEGRHVKEGQLLFRLDPRRYEADLQAARAALQRAEADLALARQQEQLVNARVALKQAEANLLRSTQDVERLRPLAAERAVPERDLDAAVAQENVARAAVEGAEATVRTTAAADKARIAQCEAAVESARANVAKATYNLEDTSIESPIDGIIGRSQVSAGNYIDRANSLLATISKVNPINVEFNLPEADYLRLTKKRLAGASAPQGDTIEIILSDNSVFPYKGRFTVAERAVDQRTGTIVIQASFPNPQGLIRPGQFARVRFAMDERAGALLVPERALMEVQGTRALYVVTQDGKAALRTVVTEGAHEGYAIVTSGLRGDEKVVVEGQVKIRPGAPVAVVPPAGR